MTYAVSAGSKESSFLPSKPGPNTMPGLLHDPKSRSPVAAVVVASVLFTKGALADTALDTGTPLAAAVEIGALAGVAPVDAEPTAASISAAVTSATSKFCEKIYPSASFASLHEFPFPVLSVTEPGAKVPLCMAVWGSPPTEAICIASASAISLFVAAAFAEAGSYEIVILMILLSLIGRDIPGAD